MIFFYFFILFNLYSFYSFLVDTTESDAESEEKAQKALLDAFVGGGRADDNDDNEEEKAYVDPEGLTIEQRVRKERPPSRIRFAESAQPDYVMMALEGVGLMYGNQVVLKDATFSVTTGERIGLVGPNGGGKVTRNSNQLYYFNDVI